MQGSYRMRADGGHGSRPRFPAFMLAVPKALHLPGANARRGHGGRAFVLPRRMRGSVRYAQGGARARQSGYSTT